MPDLNLVLQPLECVLQHLVRRTLTPEQTHMVTYQSMPRFVSILLKLRCPDAHMFDHLNDFFQTVLRSTAELLRTSDVWELVECAARVLTDGAAYQIYEGPEMRSGAGHRGSHVQVRGGAESVADNAQAALWVRGVN